MALPSAISYRKVERHHLRKAKGYCQAKYLVCFNRFTLKNHQCVKVRYAIGSRLIWCKVSFYLVCMGFLNMQVGKRKWNNRVLATAFSLAFSEMSVYQLPWGAYAVHFIIEQLIGVFFPFIYKCRNFEIQLNLNESKCQGKQKNLFKSSRSTWLFKWASQPPFLDHLTWDMPKCLPRHCFGPLQSCEMPLNFPICHLRKGSKGKLPKTIFDFLNADSSRSKCSFNLNRQAVNLNNGEGMQVLCQLKSHLEIHMAFKLVKVMRILWQFE